MEYLRSIKTFENVKNMIVQSNTMKAKSYKEFLLKFFFNKKFLNFFKNFETDLDVIRKDLQCNTNIINKIEREKEVLLLSNRKEKIERLVNRFNVFTRMTSSILDKAEIKASNRMIQTWIYGIFILPIFVASLFFSFSLPVDTSSISTMTSLSTITGVSHLDYFSAYVIGSSAIAKELFYLTDLKPINLNQVNDLTKAFFPEGETSVLKTFASRWNLTKKNKFKDVLLLILPMLLFPLFFIISLVFQVINHNFFPHINQTWTEGMNVQIMLASLALGLTKCIITTSTVRSCRENLIILANQCKKNRRWCIEKINDEWNKFENDLLASNHLDDAEKSKLEKELFTKVVSFKRKAEMKNY